jgi:hypothetical protein
MSLFIGITYFVCPSIYVWYIYVNIWIDKLKEKDTLFASYLKDASIDLPVSSNLKALSPTSSFTSSSFTSTSPKKRKHVSHKDTISSSDVLMELDREEEVKEDEEAMAKHNPYNTEERR